METEKVLDAIESLFDKFLVYPSQEERDAAVVWTAASWVAEKFDNFPRLYFRAAEYGAGKSVAGEAVTRLSRESYEMVGATPSVVYRLIENAEKPPVVFLDEVDNVFGTAGSSSSHTELLGVLNKGFHRNGVVYRSRGQDDVKEFRCFAPMVLAGKGILPKAMMTRSITVSMRRPVEGETYTPYRERVHKPFFDAVKEALEKWAGLAARDIGTEFPELPASLKGRDIDVWEPLIMVADMAEGSQWPERIRKAAVTLTNREDVKEEPPPGTKFVQTLARMFRESSRISQADVAAEMKISKHALGKLSREMDFHAVRLKINGVTAVGWDVKQYEEAFHV